MPTNNDLTGAAKALIRLRSTYNIDLQKFSTGNILGLATEAQLNTKDSFFLGRYAYMAGQHYEAKKWLELAAFQVAAEPHNETTVSRSQLDQMLAHLSQKVGHVSSDMEEEGPEDVSKYKLGIVPPKTHDRDKMVTDGDNLNFAALCRGVDLLPVNVAKDLKCYYTTKNDPYYNLHPVQVEVHHPEPHLILSYHNILSNSEADKLVSVAQPRMTQASIGHGKEVSEMRVSRNCWIKDFGLDTLTNCHTVSIGSQNYKPQGRWTSIGRAKRKSTNTFKWPTMASEGITKVTKILCLSTRNLILWSTAFKRRT